MKIHNDIQNSSSSSPALQHLDIYNTTDGINKPPSDNISPAAVITATPINRSSPITLYKNIKPQQQDLNNKFISTVQLLETEHSDSKPNNEFSVVTIDKKAVDIPDNLKLRLREGEEVEFYIPARHPARQLSLWYWALFSLALFIIGIVGVVAFQNPGYYAVLGFGLVPLVCGMLAWTNPANRMHHVITDSRVVAIATPLLWKRRVETSFEFLSMLRQLIESNEHRHLISAWYNDDLQGAIESSSPYFRVKRIKNTPMVIDHLALQFNRIAEQQKYNIPNFRPKTQQLAEGRPFAYSYMILTVAFLLGFIGLSLMTIILTENMVICTVFTFFGFIWSGFAGIAVSYGVNRYVSEKNKRAGRYYFIANNVEAPPVAHDPVVIVQPSDAVVQF